MFLNCNEVIILGKKGNVRETDTYINHNLSPQTPIEYGFGELKLYNGSEAKKVADIDSDLVKQIMDTPPTNKVEINNLVSGLKQAYNYIYTMSVDDATTEGVAQNVVETLKTIYPEMTSYKVGSITKNGYGEEPNKISAKDILSKMKALDDASVTSNTSIKWEQAPYWSGSPYRHAEEETFDDVLYRIKDIDYKVGNNTMIVCGGALENPEGMTKPLNDLITAINGKLQSGQPLNYELLKSLSKNVEEKIAKENTNLENPEYEKILMSNSKHENYLKAMNIIEKSLNSGPVEKSTILNVILGVGGSNPCITLIVEDTNTKIIKARFYNYYTKNNTNELELMGPPPSEYYLNLGHRILVYLPNNKFIATNYPSSVNQFTLEGKNINKNIRIQIESILETIDGMRNHIYYVKNHKSIEDYMRNYIEEMVYHIHFTNDDDYNINNLQYIYNTIWPRMDDLLKDLLKISVTSYLDYRISEIMDNTILNTVFVPIKYEEFKVEIAVYYSEKTIEKNKKWIEEQLNIHNKQRQALLEKRNKHIGAKYQQSLALENLNKIKSLPDDKIFAYGFVNKKHGKSIFKLGRMPETKRLLVLMKDKLQYFDNGGELKGSIILKNIESVEICGAKNCSKAKSMISGNWYNETGFVIKTSDDGEYYFRCEISKNANSWVKKIDDARKNPPLITEGGAKRKRGRIATKKRRRRIGKVSTRKRRKVATKKPRRVNRVKSMRGGKSSTKSRKLRRRRKRSSRRRRKTSSC